MEYYEQTIDDKYTVGIAAWICLLPLAVIYFVIRPLLVLMCDGPWIPWLLLLFFAVLPPSMAFIILYCNAWHLEWSRPKRVLLFALFSCVIYGADLLMMITILFVALSCPGFVWGHQE